MKRLNIIIVAEGAIDCNNKPITTDHVKDVSTATQTYSRQLLLGLYRYRAALGVASLADCALWFECSDAHTHTHTPCGKTAS